LNQVPVAELRHCVHCNAPLCLVLQLYCPPETAVSPQRVLFLMACPRPTCLGRRPGASPLRLLRATLPPPTTKRKKTRDAVTAQETMKSAAPSGMETGADEADEAVDSATAALSRASLGASHSSEVALSNWGVAAADWGGAAAATGAEDWGASEDEWGSATKTADDWGGPAAANAEWGGMGDLEARLAQRETGLLQQEAAAVEAQRKAAEDVASAKRAAAAHSTQALVDSAGSPPATEDVAPHYGFQGWYLYFQEVRRSGGTSKRRNAEGSKSAAAASTA